MQVAASPSPAGSAESQSHVTSGTGSFGQELIQRRQAGDWHHAQVPDCASTGRRRMRPRTLRGSIRSGHRRPMDACLERSRRASAPVPASQAWVHAVFHVEHHDPLGSPTSLWTTVWIHRAADVAGTLSTSVADDELADQSRVGPAVDSPEEGRCGYVDVAVEINSGTPIPVDGPANGLVPATVTTI